MYQFCLFFFHYNLLSIMPYMCLTSMSFSQCALEVAARQMEPTSFPGWRMSSSFLPSLTVPGLPLPFIGIQFFLSWRLSITCVCCLRGSACQYSLPRKAHSFRLASAHQKPAHCLHQSWELLRGVPRQGAVTFSRRDVQHPASPSTTSLNLCVLHKEAQRSLMSEIKYVMKSGFEIRVG